MKVLRLTLLWVFAFTAAALGASTVAPFGVSAETRVGESMIYPVYRFYRGGAFASVTSATIERVLSDQIIGLPDTVSDRGEYLKRLARHFYQLCIDYRLDPAFVLSLIEVESSFRSDVVSPAGAVGLMQLMPATARVIYHRYPSLRPLRNTGRNSGRNLAIDLKDPFQNLTIGMTYLRELKTRYLGLSPYFHLAAYNIGPHRLDVLRARPGFKPEKTLKYFQDIMRGVENWRHYGSQSFPPELKPKADVARKSSPRNVDPV